MTKVTESNNNSKKFKKVLLSVFKKLKIKNIEKALMVKALKKEDFKMARMTKKALISLARSLDAIDLTYDHAVRKGCENLMGVAYSAGMYGCNGCILKDQEGNFFVIKDRTSALWIYGF